ncbi:hypothetical protein TWF696_001158 [Orbilia brochopaga]|uniref:F-box domain-containing protein n=1 Tax=Orbilia brochopaga TaxID=3140254 RepID=A0AAV9VE03_9PEZI
MGQYSLPTAEPSAFERCAIDVVHLIFDSCDADSIRNLSLANRAFQHLTEPLIYRHLEFRLIDGDKYELKNFIRLKTLHSSSKAHLWDYVRELSVQKEWYKSEVRNVILLDMIEKLIPRLECLTKITTNTAFTTKFMQYLEGRSKTSQLQVCFRGRIKDAHMLVPPTDGTGYCWHSVSTVIDPRSVTEETRLLAKLLSKAWDLKELDVEFDPEIVVWDNMHDNPFSIFLQKEHPRLNRLRLRGYYSHLPTLGIPNCPLYEIAILKSMTAHLDHIDVDIK